MSDDAENKSTVFAVAGWVWGTVEGGFNEQQTTSQVIVDATVSLVPVVGDATAARDLLAVSIRLVRNPEKRKERGEWITLVVLLFALIPVIGGAFKGVGLLLLRVGVDVAKAESLFRPALEVLNRVGHGNALKWLKELDFEAHMAEVRGKWVELADRLSDAMTRMLEKLRSWLPETMLNHLQNLRDAVRELKATGEEMIPDALKELNKRLKALQEHIYEGEWHEIPSSLRSSTREAEARIVEEAKTEEKAWVMDHAHFPPNTKDAYHEVAGWPVLTEHKKAKDIIPAFSGPVRPVRLKAGQRIYRVLDGGKSNPAGFWWTHELPPNGRVWREEIAVLEGWSKNGQYVELVVPSGGLWIWEGTVSSQIDRSVGTATGGQYLKGGGTQIFLDFDFDRNAYAKPLAQSAPRRATNWDDHLGIDIPDKVATTQRLGEHEIATKRHPAVAGARVAAKAERLDHTQDTP